MQVACLKCLTLCIYIYIYISESNGKLPRLFIPSKTATLVPEFEVEDSIYYRYPHCRPWRPIGMWIKGSIIHSHALGRGRVTSHTLGLLYPEESSRYSFLGG